MASLERLAARRLGKSAAERIGAAAALGAIGVLLRRHPKVAAELAAIGAVRAVRAGLEETERWLDAKAGGNGDDAARPARPVRRKSRKPAARERPGFLTPGERRRLMRRLKTEAGGHTEAG